MEKSREILGKNAKDVKFWGLNKVLGRRRDSILAKILGWTLAGRVLSKQSWNLKRGLVVSARMDFYRVVRNS